MIHKGEIVEKAVRKSGLPLTQLAKRMGKSRRWLYNAFDNPNVTLEHILQIGSIIHHNFSDEILDLQRFKNFEDPVSEENTYTVSSENAEYWKNKYLTLLEKYNTLLGG